MHLREQEKYTKAGFVYFYLHKAVMEEQTEELPGDGRVQVGGRSHCVSDNKLGRRA